MGTKRSQGDSPAAGGDFWSSFGIDRNAGSKRGGLRDKTAERNERRHMEALQEARRYWRILRLHKSKSLNQIGRELFDMGLKTRRGKQLSPSMVQRLIDRYEELSEYPDLRFGVDEAIATRNAVSLQWHYRMVIKEGIRNADLFAPWAGGGEDEIWIRKCLPALGLDPYQPQS